MSPPSLAPARWVLAVLVLCQGISLVPAGGGGSPWTYAGPHGQDHWPDTYPDCGGTAQSPIDIQSSDVEYEPSLPPIQPEGYRSPEDPLFMLSNNGHTVEMSLSETMFLHGLPRRYNAVQLHLHWGSRSRPLGSEHQLDGQKFPAELHIVHFNSERYANVSQAKNKPDGLAVLGILIEAGEIVNEAYENILKYLSKVKFAGGDLAIYVVAMVNAKPFLYKADTSFYQIRGLKFANNLQLGIATFYNKIPKADKSYVLSKLDFDMDSLPPRGEKISIPSFNVLQLLPEKLDQFYRYRGSLTTPPCHQSVLWTVFHQKVQLSKSQLENLQGALHSTGPESSPIPLVENFRTTQTLNQRTVYSSFPVGSTFTYSAGEVVAIVFGILFGFLGLFFAVHVITKSIRASKRTGQKDIVLKSSSALPSEQDSSANI